jgi:pentatricopeptide repeat protein
MLFSSTVSILHLFLSYVAQVSVWMNAKGHVKFLPKDHAVQLDLIGQVHGVEAAETYFNDLSEKDKTEKPYGALLNCYTRELLVDKALAHFQKMKKLGFLFSPLSYNNIMGLYTKLGQHEKVPSVIAEMKSNGVIPDNFSYRICINSYGTKADFFGMENTLEEMECEPQIVVDWNTYAVVASNYIKGDLREKAYSALQKAEAKIVKRDSDAYNHLISLYGQLGDKSEVKRLCALQMSNCNRHINKDYTTMLATLVKLDEIAEAEALLKEWESSGSAFDFNVPNVVLTGYRQKGLLDKAEMLLNSFSEKGKMAPSSSWAIVAIGYAEKEDAGKAYELTKNALRVYAPESGWIPRSSMIEMILKYLGDEADLKDVESFIDMLKVVPMNSDMTEALSRARVRKQKKAEETTEALSS